MTADFYRHVTENTKRLAAAPLLLLGRSLARIVQ